MILAGDPVESATVSKPRASGDDPGRLASLHTQIK